MLDAALLTEPEVNQSTGFEEGEDIFSEARSLLFKTLRVKRIYDPEAKNILYVGWAKIRK